ncbi:MAG: riboflavin kinase, partial [Dehalococcoidales bacterium]
EREHRLKEAGTDIVVALSFTQELARLSAPSFLGLLKKYLRMRGLVIGYDFALGLDRQGNIEKLHLLGQEMGFSVRAIAPVTIDGEVASSTAIRQALSQGDMARVSRLLGHSFSLRGRVVPGASRGKELGYPTANLMVDPEQALPANGVYASLAHLGGKSYPSMTYIGHRPTFDEAQQVVENYLLDFTGNLYNKEMVIDIRDYLRGDQHFESAEALKNQITADVARGRKLLENTGKER